MIDLNQLVSMMTRGDRPETAIYHGRYDIEQLREAAKLMAKAVEQIELGLKNGGWK